MVAQVSSRCKEQKDVEGTKLMVEAFWGDGNACKVTEERSSDLLLLRLLMWCLLLACLLDLGLC